MRVEKVDKEKMLTFLRKKWKNMECPYCGERSWAILNVVFSIKSESSEGLPLGAIPIIAVIPVICKNCGNTVLINDAIAHVGTFIENNKNEKKGVENND